MINEILKHFEKICSIPHNTFCEKELSNHIVNFAKAHNFYYVQDKANNVYIKKLVDSDKPFVCFQSHLDMVCVKDPNYQIDFSVDPIKTIKTKKYLKAYKTSLGADNGIGVALILTLLENANYNIEALFTTDEEVSTTGAMNFDYSLIKSKNLISFDGFRANEMIIGCASICDSKITFNPNFNFNKVEGNKLVVSNLKGGHSGAEIDKKLGNAIKISIELLESFKNVKLENFTCGNQFNFIPNFAILTFEGTINKIEFDKKVEELKKEFPQIQISCQKQTTNKTLSFEQSSNILNLLKELKNGVIFKDKTGILLSQNLAYINLEEGLIKISQRGSNLEKENDNIQFNKDLAKKYNCNFNIFDKKNGFLTNKDCRLVKTLSKISLQTNKIALKKSVKHVSLEECVFQEKLPDVEMVVVSPKIEFPHSIKERVLLSSIEKTYTLIENYLKAL